MQPFDTKKAEAAAEAAISYENPPPSYTNPSEPHGEALSEPPDQRQSISASRPRQSLSTSILPLNTSFVVSKTGLSHNLIVESSTGPLFTVAIHSSVSTRENPTIKISRGSKLNSSLVATAELTSLSSEVILRLPGQTDVAPTEMLQGGASGKSFLFRMALYNQLELLEWKPTQDRLKVTAWTCYRCDTGEAVMHYRKAGFGLGRKMGEANWTAEAAETGIVDGAKGLMVFTALMAVLEKERRIESMDKGKNMDEQRIGLNHFSTKLIG